MDFLVFIAWWASALILVFAWGPELSDLMERRLPRLHRAITRTWGILRRPIDWVLSRARR